MAECIICRRHRSFGMCCVIGQMDYYLMCIAGYVCLFRSCLNELSGWYIEFNENSIQISNKLYILPIFRRSLRKYYLGKRQLAQCSKYNMEQRSADVTTAIWITETFDQTLDYFSTYMLMLLMWCECVCAQHRCSVPRKFTEKILGRNYQVFLNNS